MSGDEASAAVSIVLPVAIELPAREAVPVRCRSDDRRLVGVLPADGRYHSVPRRSLTFVSTLPDGRILQASTDLKNGGSARITLQGDLHPRARLRTLPPLPLEQHRVALRFLVQSSLGSYERSREPSLASLAVAATDQLRLRLTSSNSGVQFLQLLEPHAFPVNVAYADGTGIKLFASSGGVAANVSVLNEPTDLALMYLQAGLIEDAVATLEFGGPIAEQLNDVRDVAAAIVLLQVLLAAGRTEVDEAAPRLATRHPHVGDFHILVAEAAAAHGDERGALGALSNLGAAGLPLLYRSFGQALRRLEASALDGYAKAPDADAALALHRRLQELTPHIDVASRLLVIHAAGLDRPSWNPSKVRQWVMRWITLPIVGRFAKYQVAVKTSIIKRTEGVRMSTQDQTREAAPQAPATADAHQPTAPALVALYAAGAALLVWLGFAIFLLALSGTSDIRWARLAWVFGSVEAVGFAAAGLLFGTTVNRQRAVRAEQQAAANQRDAEGGRALAAALKADEPAVVQEDQAGGPKGMGVPGVPGPGDAPAIDVATRHARLARQLFP